MGSVVVSRALHQPGVQDGRSGVAVATYAAEKTGDPARQAISAITRADGTLQMAVEIDSIQSQSNRVEEALLRLRNERRIRFPKVEVEIARDRNVPLVLDQLQIPHRIAGAELRNSTFSTKHPYKPEPLTDIRTDLSYLLTWSIQSLVLGCWNSMQAPMWKLPRIWEARVMGYAPATEHEVFTVQPSNGKQTNVQAVNQFYRGVQKTDRLLNAAQVKVDKLTDKERAAYKLLGQLPPVSPSSTPPKGDDRLSVYVLGDIPNGVKPSNRFNFISVEQRIYVSLSSIDRFCFPDQDGGPSGRNEAGREMVRALCDLFTAILLAEPLDYRSGCQLAPVPGTTREIRIDNEGNETSFSIPENFLDRAIIRWHAALDAGEKKGLIPQSGTFEATSNLQRAVAIAGKHIVGDSDGSTVAES